MPNNAFMRTIADACREYFSPLWDEPSIGFWQFTLSTIREACVSYFYPLPLIWKALFGRPPREVTALEDSPNWIRLWLETLSEAAGLKRWQPIMFFRGKEVGS